MWAVEHLYLLKRISVLDESVEAMRVVVPMKSVEILFSNQMSV